MIKRFSKKLGKAVDFVSRIPKWVKFLIAVSAVFLLFVIYAFMSEGV